MNSKAEIELKLKQIKPELASKFHVTSIGYFGSYADGNATDNSDLDLLVEFSEPIGWKFFTLETFLEKALDIKIDLVTKGALKEKIKDLILNQVKYV